MEGARGFRNRRRNDERGNRGNLARTQGIGSVDVARG